MENKKCTIFYSWQSDIKISRNFISDCLNRLGKKMKNFVLCDIDRDTQGLAGAPDIGDSIYEKIDSADIFVADVTIINGDYAGRKTPNPNVLIELGYAIKALGWDRIILLYDKDFGEIEELPFDINHRRITSFSLGECEEKAKVREYVLSCIIATIQILEQEHRLHGGSADIVKAQLNLGQIIFTGLEVARAAYVERKRNGETDLYDKIQPVNEAQLALVEKIHEVLTDEQYQLINSILFYMKMSRIGNDDMSGWEFAEQLVEECFEDLYVEYADEMWELPMQCTLKKNVVELLNALSFDKHFKYEEKRIYDGSLVFSTVMDEMFACDREGKILCKGKLDEKGFTGYKCTRDYEGEYVAGKKYGEGKEYCITYDYKEWHHLLQEGIWENDIFIQGRMNGVLVENINGAMELVQIEEGRVVTKKDDGIDFLFESEEDYYWADVSLKDGEYEIIDGSVERVLNEFEVI